MGLPRSKYVEEGKEGVYHCFSRCVRRAFLYGYDALTGRDFSHRKAWLVNRLRKLGGIFAIDVCAYTVMENHYHVVVRTCPDRVAGWTDEEVARRWLTLFPRCWYSRGGGGRGVEEGIRVLVRHPERIAILRKRLSSLSWFMGRVNEYMARTANKEDEVKGRFWESRFKCQALLDEAAMVACMVYVDLNPIRAGRAGTPEGSEYTSIRERILAWQEEQKAAGGDLGRDEGGRESVEGAGIDTFWLCPIASGTDRRGILSMTAMEYIDLVDQSGRIMRTGKRGAIEADLAPILVRIGVNPGRWVETVSGFGDNFSLVAGMVLNLRNYAEHFGRRWFRGIGASRAAFASPPAQPA